MRGACSTLLAFSPNVSPKVVAAVALQAMTSRQSKGAVLDATISKGNARQLRAFHLLDNGNTTVVAY